MYLLVGVTQYACSTGNGLSTRRSLSQLNGIGTTSASPGWLLNRLGVAVFSVRPFFFFFFGEGGIRVHTVY